ncbi:MAG: AMP-dependent synthetase and ligase [Firmicutes bacterium]|nr:AMP-dependent synthetase and ligase [Bacillota bacterium]
MTSGEHPQFSNSSPLTVVALLRQRAEALPNQTAYTYLSDRGTEEGTLTYAELDRGARAIAAQLQAMGLQGSRALLLYPSGLEYIKAFFGCLYAGVVAVPAYPPRQTRNLSRLLAIVRNAEVSIILATQTVMKALKNGNADAADFARIPWAATDGDTPDSGKANRWREPKLDAGSLAFLQYTSGSTGTPKGVMVNHGNLVHNSAAINQMMIPPEAEGAIVSWLPMYHDMGLIGGILQPLYAARPGVLMSPLSFLMAPHRWLDAISQYRGAISGGPDFAYELCVRRVTPEQRATLDLSSWKVAFSGAEPVRPGTMDRFVAAFAACGLEPDACYPCYGLAEATLLVSGSGLSRGLHTVAVRKADMAENRVVRTDNFAAETQLLVGCGSAPPGHRIVIAHPERLTACAPDEIGEIWVAGPSKAQGYWNQPQLSQDTFAARLADAPAEGPFLRTGDLGFLAPDGELFPTGRIKDLLIIRGQNHYPQDIERTVQESEEAIRAGGCAAFSVEEGGEERLVVVAEVERQHRRGNMAELATRIGRAVSTTHGLAAHAVVLVAPGGIPRTSSGKIQRFACREGYRTKTLAVLSAAGDSTSA